ncbi:hypothetical protein [Streptomyces asiaticus]
MTPLETQAIPDSDLVAVGGLIVLVGIPGCGKSTFAARYPASWRVCLDEYRLAATDDMTDQTATPDRVVPGHVLSDLHAQLPTVDQLRSEGFTAVHLASELA